jgi:4-hydroxythreonine-4-phosphate dehydrogenase
MKKFKVGISIGDINGIGPEIILKALSDERMLDMCTPVIYGSSKVLSYYKNTLANGEDIRFQGTSTAQKAAAGRINVVNCWQGNTNVSLGKATEESGKSAYIALDKALTELKEGHIDALVTAPINKKAMNMADFPYAGHTEYLTQASGAKGSLMLMVNDGLRVGLVTNHLPLRDVAANVTKDAVRKKLKTFNETLKMDFGIVKPVIAVLGLNPHAGDDGVLGKEEDEVIRPVIIEVKKKGIMAFGPYPADGFFGSGQYKKFDGILAMYHDQGLVAFKSLSFGDGTNYTAGLGFIRTSPDHGTAYDIAGKDEADPTSLRRAIFLAKDIHNHRKEYLEDHANAVEHVQIEAEEQPEG